MTGFAEEMLDVITPDGVWTGVTKPKSQVHDDGDWHACVHGVITDGRGRIVTQFRGPKAKLMRNAWDVMSVAGHFTALTPEERKHPELWDLVQQAWRALVREFDEELGFDLAGYAPFSDDVAMFGITRTNQHTEDGWIDRTLNVNFMIRLPNFDIQTVKLEEGKVLRVEWKHVNDIEHGFVALPGGGREEIAVREPDHHQLVQGTADCAYRMMLADTSEAGYQPRD